MDRFLEWKSSVAASFAGMSTGLSWFEWLVIVFIICMMTDCLTGSLAALRKGQWNPSAAIAGVWRKIGSLITVIVSGLADIVIGLIVNNLTAITIPFNYTVFICPFVLVWYVVTELRSIIKNADDLDARIPAFLKKILKALLSATDAAGDRLSVDAGDSKHNDKTK